MRILRANSQGCLAVMPLKYPGAWARLNALVPQVNSDRPPPPGVLQRALTDPVAIANDSTTTAQAVTAQPAYQATGEDIDSAVAFVPQTAGGGPAQGVQPGTTVLGGAGDFFSRVLGGIGNILTVLLGGVALILLGTVAIRPAQLAWPGVKSGSKWGWEKLLFLELVLLQRLPEDSVVRIRFSRVLVRLLPKDSRQAAAARFLGDDAPQQ